MLAAPVPSRKARCGINRYDAVGHVMGRERLPDWRRFENRLVAARGDRRSGVVLAGSTPLACD